MIIRARYLRNHGFTLIEMMAAMAIGSIILLSAAYLLRSTGESYDRVGGNIAAEREARAAIAQMRSDMESAMHHPIAPFSNTDGVLSFLSLQPAVAQSDAGRIGDVCAVNYRLIDIPTGTRNIRALVRGFRESGETFAALGVGDTGELFDYREIQDEPVAFDVLAFNTTPVSRDDSGSWVPWSPSIADAPEAVNIRLVFARRELFGRLKTASDWDDKAVLADTAENEREVEIYETRIRFGHHDPL